MRLVLLIALITVLSGATPVAARFAVSELPPFMLAWFRFGTAGTLLWLTLRLRGEQFPFTRKDIPKLIVLGLLCVPVNQFSFLFGVKNANASHAGLFYALTPFMVFWGAVLAKQARFQALMLAAALLASGGAFLVIWPGLSGTRDGGSFLLGDLLLLMAVASWSAFVVGSKPLLGRFKPLPMLAAVFLTGWVLQTPLVFLDAASFSWEKVTLRGIGGFAFLALCTSYLNYLLYYVALVRFDAARLMVVTNGSFLVTVLFEYLIFGEILTIYFFLGAALILGAIAFDTARVWGKIGSEPSIRRPLSRAS